MIKSIDSKDNVTIIMRKFKPIIICSNYNRKGVEVDVCTSCKELQIIQYYEGTAKVCKTCFLRENREY
jgi:hypothetical protein